MDKLILKAGVPTQFGESGTFFRVLSASAEIDIRFMGEGWSLDTPLAAGIGINFINRPTPYDKVTLTSPIDQTIEYFAGFDIADDDRLSGNLDLDGAVSMISTLPKYHTYSTVAAGIGVEMFPARTGRRALTFTNSEEIVLDTGETLAAGELIEWNTQSALTMTSGTGTVTIWEDFD